MKRKGQLTPALLKECHSVVFRIGMFRPVRAATEDATVQHRSRFGFLEPASFNLTDNYFLALYAGERGKFNLQDAVASLLRRDGLQSRFARDAGAVQKLDEVRHGLFRIVLS